MRRGISQPPEENPAIPVRTCGCAAVFVRAFARKQAPCAGRTGFAQDSSLDEAYPELKGAATISAIDHPWYPRKLPTQRRGATESGGKPASRPAPFGPICARIPRNSRNYVADATRKYQHERGGRRDPLAIGRTGLPSEYRARPARILCTSVLGEIPRA